MDYINLLSDVEKEKLCQMISGRRLKKLFRKKSNDFSKILRGFRADSLTEEQALTIGIANIEAPFIHTYINQKVEYWIGEVQKNIQNSVAVGLSEDRAILNALMDSAFHDTPAFYFLFTQSSKDNSYISMTEAALSAIQAAQTSSQDCRDDLISRKALSAEHAEWEKERRNLQKDLDALRSEKDRLNTALNTELEKSSALSENILSMSDELSDYRRRAARVNATSDFTSKDGFPFSSLCSVYTDYEGRYRLRRLADIEHNEILDSFCESFPIYEYLFAKDGPQTEEFIGIWDWKTTPLDNDPSRDYVLTSYNEKFSPIQVYFLNNFSSAREILQGLISGLECKLNTEKVLFCFRDAAVSQYTGILCTQKELQCVNGKFYLKDTVINVPAYRISYSETLQKQDLTFLRSINPGIPEKLLPVKDELEYVRDIILQQASWSAFKQKGLQHSDQRMVKEFLAELPAAQILQEISNRCDCDSTHAQELLAEFRNRAEEYLDGSDMSSDLLAEIAQNHAALFSACKESIRAQWNHENAQMLSDAQSAFDKVRHDADAEELRCIKLQKQYSAVKQDYDKIAAKLASREKLAQEVEEKVSRKIENARQKAADFIAEQAFCTVPVSAAAAVKENHWVPGHPLCEENLEKSSSWKTSLDIMASELEEAGVASQYIREFSAFLMACSCNHTVPLLAGPCGQDIADACCAALYGTTSIIITNPDQITSADLQELSAYRDSVVILENPFCSGAFRCVEHLRNCFLIAVNPFAEDLLIEPAEFANYYLPVMTELLVDKVPTRHFLGSIPTKDFVPYTPCSPVRLHSSLLNKLKLSTLSQKKLQQVLSDLHRILQSDDCGLDLLFALLPLSYTCRKMDILFESSIKNTCSKDMQELLNRYWSDSQ